MLISLTAAVGAVIRLNVRGSDIGLCLIRAFWAQRFTDGGDVVSCTDMRRREQRLRDCRVWDYARFVGLCDTGNSKELGLQKLSRASSVRTPGFSVIVDFMFQQASPGELQLTVNLKLLETLLRPLPRFAEA